MKTLRQGETHLAHGKKIRLSFDTFRDRACAYAVGELENPSAYDLFQAIDRAATDEFSIDFDLHEREISKLHQGGPFSSEIVDRDADLVKSKLFG